MEKTIKVIGICGKKRAGKDTVGEIIQKNINHYSRIYHMAKPLKESVKILYDLNYEQLHGFSKDIIDDRSHRYSKGYYIQYVLRNNNRKIR